MRKIKFRVWTGSGMEYRVVVGVLGAFYVEGIDPKDAACMSPFNTKYSEQTPLMQFTGLLDKNGKEIYEGDVTRGIYPETEKDVGFSCMVVAWGDDGFVLENPKRDNFYFGDLAMPCLNKSIEVIGNIYEHPELLSQVKIANKD